MKPITEQIEELVKEAIPDCQVVAEGAGGHFVIEVTSAAFEGKSIIQKQRMVYKAIWDLMKGNNAPVHAVDKLICKLPQ